MQIDVDAKTVGGGVAGLAAVIAGLRAFFVHWKRENASVANAESTTQGAEATAAMMANFHAEIVRLAEGNKAFAEENGQLRKQVGRLEALLEKLCVKFEIDLSEFEDAT